MPRVASSNYEFQQQSFGAYKRQKVTVTAFQRATTDFCSKRYLTANNNNKEKPKANNMFCFSPEFEQNKETYSAVLNSAPKKWTVAYAGLFAIDRLHLHLITYRWSFYCNRRVQ
jgi:hypothetical protein